ncbi:MAG: ABC transporter ATP-binding protein, partial [Candidatus Eremiobacteraeota bacterium]|nr:ABC transporter ATP-binding protein [Candidatus Eremiobacteraeota bacterium]
VLVLDEASSALDKRTEKEIFEGLLANKNITLIAISHNLQILKECDPILLLQDGRLRACGTFDELCACNDLFRHLASVDASNQDLQVDEADMLVSTSPVAP